MKLTKYAKAIRKLLTSYHKKYDAFGKERKKNK